MKPKKITKKNLQKKKDKKIRKHQFRKKKKQDKLGKPLKPGLIFKSRILRNL